MNKSKKIALLLLAFILAVNINIFVFATLYELNASLVNAHAAKDIGDVKAKASFTDALYFSGITYLTIGYGDFKTVNDIGKFLAVLQGFSGVIINSVFTGFFLYYLVKRPKNIIISNKLYVRYKKQNHRFYLSVRVGNKGRALVNVNRILELFTAEECIKTRRFQLSQEYHYLEDILYWDIDLEKSENRQLLYFLQEGLFTEKALSIRISITGTDVDAGDLVFVANNYFKKDILFIADYVELYRHRKNKKPKIYWKSFHRVVALEECKIQAFKELR